MSEERVFNYLTVAKLLGGMVQEGLQPSIPYLQHIAIHPELNVKLAKSEFCKPNDDFDVLLLTPGLVCKHPFGSIVFDYPDIKNNIDSVSTMQQLVQLIVELNERNPDCAVLYRGFAIDYTKTSLFPFSFGNKCERGVFFDIVKDKNGDPSNNGLYLDNSTFNPKVARMDAFLHYKNVINAMDAPEDVKIEFAGRCYLRGIKS